MCNVAEVVANPSATESTSKPRSLVVFHFKHAGSVQGVKHLRRRIYLRYRHLDGPGCMTYFHCTRLEWCWFVIVQSRLVMESDWTVGSSVEAWTPWWNQGEFLAATITARHDNPSASSHTQWEDMYWLCNRPT